MFKYFLYHCLYKHSQLEKFWKQGKTEFAWGPQITRLTSETKKTKKQNKTTSQLSASHTLGFGSKKNSQSCKLFYLISLFCKLNFGKAFFPVNPLIPWNLAAASILTPLSGSGWFNPNAVEEVNMMLWMNYPHAFYWSTLSDRHVGSLLIEWAVSPLWKKPLCT